MAFAHTQGLPVAIPEWGLNGADDPTFINVMAGLIKNPANDITVEAYFNFAGDTNSDITQFPRPKRRTERISDDLFMGFHMQHAGSHSFIV